MYDQTKSLIKNFDTKIFFDVSDVGSSSSLDQRG